MRRFVVSGRLIGGLLLLVTPGCTQRVRDEPAVATAKPTPTAERQDLMNAEKKAGWISLRWTGEVRFSYEGKAAKNRTAQASVAFAVPLAERPLYPKDRPEQAATTELALGQGLFLQLQIFSATWSEGEGPPQANVSTRVRGNFTRQFQSTKSDQPIDLPILSVLASGTGAEFDKLDNTMSQDREGDEFRYSVRSRLELLKPRQPGPPEGLALALSPQSEAAARFAVHKPVVLQGPEDLPR